MAAIINKSTTFWGAACISQREGQKAPDPYVYRESTNGQSLAANYTYQMPAAGGKDIVIYVLENTVALGFSPKNLQPDNNDDRVLQEKLHIAIDHHNYFYSSLLLRADLRASQPQIELGSLAAGGLDIEDDRLEVLWPIYKIKLKPPKPGDPQIEKIVCPEFTSKKNAQDNHGNMVANLAAGTSYGLAPNAKVVLVNRIPASDVPGSQGGIGLAYCAILEHYQTLPIGTRAILSISAGSAAASIEYSIDSFKRVDDLIEAGIIIVAAAGNRAENQLTNITKDAEKKFLDAVKSFPTSQEKAVQDTLDALKKITEALEAVVWEVDDDPMKSKIKNLLNGADHSLKEDIEKQILATTKGTLVTSATGEKTYKPLNKAAMKGRFRTVWKIAQDTLDALSNIVPKDPASVNGAGRDKVQTLADRTTLLKTANEPLQILYAPNAPKIPAVHPEVLSVGGLTPKNTICKEFFYGEAIDIYAPAEAIPFVYITNSTDNTKIIHDTYEDEDIINENKKIQAEIDKEKSEEAKNKLAATKKITWKRPQGTSFATPTTAGAIASLLSQNAIYCHPESHQNLTNQVGLGKVKDQIRSIARQVKEGDVTYDVLCIGPGCDNME